MARDESRDTVPDAIPAPDILGDFTVWSEAHWDYWTLRRQPESWLTKIQMAHAEQSRIQAELYDDLYRADRKSDRGRPINDAEVAEIQAANPKLASLPAAALKKLYRRRDR